MESTPQFHINLKEDMEWQMQKLHFHDSIEIMLVLSEHGQFFLDKNMYSLEKNSLIILQANTLHRTAFNSNETIFQRYVFHILPSLVEQVSTAKTNFVSILNGCSTCIQLSDSEATILAALFEKLRATLNTNEFAWDIKRRITIMEILIQVCSSLRTNHYEDIVSASADYEKVLPILEYIRKNYSKQNSLDEIADHFHLSKHHLCHIFKKGTGFSIMEYIIQARIIEAQRLLRTGCSVQEAGEKSGFQTYAHFIRTFNNYTGTSPKRYAKQFQSGEQISVSANMSSENYY